MNWNCDKCGKRVDCLRAGICDDCHARTLPDSYECRECGRWFNQAMTMQKLRPGLCFNCDFWTDLVAQISNPMHLVIGGRHYADCGPGLGGGFGGDRFVYQRLNDAAPRETRNLWHRDSIRWTCDRCGEVLPGRQAVRR